jgi:hypothetical protein
LEIYLFYAGTRFDSGSPVSGFPAPGQIVWGQLFHDGLNYFGLSDLSELLSMYEPI